MTFKRSRSPPDSPLSCFHIVGTRYYPSPKKMDYMTKSRLNTNLTFKILLKKNSRYNTRLQASISKSQTNRTSSYQTPGSPSANTRSKRNANEMNPLMLLAMVKAKSSPSSKRLARAEEKKDLIGKIEAIVAGYIARKYSIAISVKELHPLNDGLTVHDNFGGRYRLEYFGEHNFISYTHRPISTWPADLLRNMDCYIKTGSVGITLQPLEDTEASFSAPTEDSFASSTAINEYGDEEDDGTDTPLPMMLGNDNDDQETVSTPMPETRSPSPEPLTLDSHDEMDYSETELATSADEFEYMESTIVVKSSQTKSVRFASPVRSFDTGHVDSDQEMMIDSEEEEEEEEGEGHENMEQGEEEAVLEQVLKEQQISLQSAIIMEVREEQQQQQQLEQQAQVQPEDIVSSPIPEPEPATPTPKDGLSLFMVPKPTTPTHTDEPATPTDEVTPALVEFAKPGMPASMYPRSSSSSRPQTPSSPSPSLSSQGPPSSPGSLEYKQRRDRIAGWRRSRELIQGCTPNAPAPGTPLPNIQHSKPILGDVADPPPTPIKNLKRRSSGSTYSEGDESMDVPRNGNKRPRLTERRSSFGKQTWGKLRKWIGY